MGMKIIAKEKRLCTCCMEAHEVKTVVVDHTTTFKNKEVCYDMCCYYCDLADEMYEVDDQINRNNMAMKDAYRKLSGLLTSDEIIAIRSKYGITQSDLCTLLGWGGKTITRYEGHQVQDKAHDLILRKIDSDPKWYLSLLEGAKELLNPEYYEKYYKRASEICADEDQDAKKSLKEHVLPDGIKRNKDIMKLKKELDLALGPWDILARLYLPQLLCNN